MATIKDKPTRVAVIGDLVNSRAHRAHTHEALMAGLASLPPEAADLAPTVGDEIQGDFPTLGSAIHATHLLRLSMLAHAADIRFGIGVGEIVDIGDGIQDGSAWWHAREGLEAVENLAASPGWAGVRTGSPDIKAPLLAGLHLIDAHLSSLKPGVCDSLLGLLRGEANQDTATRLGITASANTQRIKSNNLRPLAAAIQALWEA
ncbi:MULTISPECIES: SatD family protein [Trueperella]|uniref:Uncharacterized protein n=1 Tax=Trueperella bernardiae TaxID=59561 RepID=A0A0W1KIJ7_9ACTO|nr:MULTISPECIES: SatD family protein [Trueperella]KTF03424.1 hypothetical protein AQZ59_01746 [Trueperella bernardiae]MDV6239716.1 SatD family protein [Trueperella bernardiae]WIM07281.1 SatD family protein [Trueperella bernardiae]